MLAPFQPPAMPELPADASRPLLSIIIPFFNEEDNVRPVLEEVRRCQPEAEIIAVDDGSRDGTWSAIQSAPGVRGLRLTQNRGQSAAVYAGLQEARGRLCALMDGDGQNDPADFATLLRAHAEGQGEVICGYRANRRDTWDRKLASRIANRIRRVFLSDGIRDTGCSLKLFPREAVTYLVPFNGLHRFLPAIFLHAGLKLAEVPVNHRPRARGISKYTNWERALRGLYDLVGVGWLLKRKILYPPLQHHE